MRFALSFYIIFTAFLPAQTQNFYDLIGPIQADCYEQVVDYFIETDAEIISTVWSVTPSGGVFIFEEADLWLYLQFEQGGVYTIYSTSLTSDSMYLRDSIRVHALGLTADVQVTGCYVVNDQSGCYEVCAHSSTILSFPVGNVVWEVVGAESYTYLNSEEIEVTWGDGGSGWVKALVGCPTTKCFEILPQPVADFMTDHQTGSDTLTACRDEEIFFENLSQNGLSYHWSFGDGNESSEFDVTHSYGQEGYYTVTLTAESVCCESEKNIVIHVLPSPAPKLDCINSVCPETRQRYSVSGTDCNQFSWQVSSNGTIVNGGGASDDFIEIIWHEGPDGIIELSVSDCVTDYCDGVNTFRIPIISPDGPVTGDAHVCSGEIVQYAVPYFPGTQYQWQVGPAGMITGDQNSNSITVRWMDVNSITASFVSVDYDNCFLECGGGDQLDINIVPEIKLTGDEVVCQNGEASILAEAGFITPNPADVQWQIQDASGAVLFTSAGTSSSLNHIFSYPPGEYQWVALNTSSAYCNDIIRKTIYVVATPEDPLGIEGEETICPGIVYGYNITSAGNFSTLWTVTDGSSTIEYEGQSIQHIFGITPPYLIEAVHADIQFNACLSDKVTFPIQTIDDLTIAGDAESCLNEVTSYSIPYISGTMYQWEIIPADAGEIRQTGLNTIDVFWTKSGSATLRLNVCGKTLEHQVDVNPLPLFNLSGLFEVCPGNVTVITTDQPSYSHNWLDESGSFIGNQNSIPLSAGTYGVELTDLNGCVEKTSFSIISLPTPTVHLSSQYPEIHCSTLPLGLEIVANTDANMNVFTWYRDDVIIAGSSPSYPVTVFGTYHVMVTNEFGCTAISDKVTFTDCCPPDTCGGNGTGNGFPIPGCNYIGQDIDILIDADECEERKYRFANPLEIEAGSVRWVVSTVTKGIVYLVDQDTLDLVYDLPGYYQMSVFARLAGFPYSASDCGHIKNFNEKIPAVAKFNHIGQCAGAPIDFADQSLFLPDETVIGWNWDFDDPASGADNISSIQNPSHIFNVPGVYNVTLTITLLSGCTSSKTIPVNISAGPSIAPVYDPIYCENESQSFVVSSNLFEIQWEFNDPASGLQNFSQGAEVFHEYAVAGIYNVIVSAADIYQCRSEFTIPVDIQTNTLSGVIDFDPSTFICFGDSAILTSSPGGVNWLWSTDETSEVIQVGESHQYSVIVEDAFHCSYSPPPIFIEVLPDPVVIIKAREILGPDIYGPWQDSLNICNGTEFELQAFSNGNVFFVWNHGADDDVIVFTGEGGNLPGTGTHTYYVTAHQIISDCISDTAFITVEINELPAKPDIDLLAGSACSHDDNALSVTNIQSGVNYVWSDGQTGASIITSDAGSMNVTAINEHGCIRKSDNIEILPSADVDKIPAGCFVKCDPLTVCLPLLEEVTSYTLYQDGIAIQTGSSWPNEFTITADGSYSFDVTTTNGCMASSDPLDVLLYQGTGTITVITYVDTDGDGTISAGDDLLPGIPVIINNGAGQSGETSTSADGSFDFTDFPASNYLVTIDQDLLSPQWTILIDSLDTEILTCDDSVVVRLLLTQNCTVSGPDQYFEICPGEPITIGDSTWMDTGSYEVHLQSTSGCDSLIQVWITEHDSIEITATVWMDVDHDGMLSAADTIVPDILIVIDEMISHDPYFEWTGTDGTTTVYYPSANYAIYLDSTLLVPGIDVIYGYDFISDTSCGVVSYDFLLTGSCSDVFLIQQETLCPGDSILIENQWITDEGVYSFLLGSPGPGCDTTLDVYVTLSPELYLTSEALWHCDDLGTIIIHPDGAGPFEFSWDQGVTGDSIAIHLQEGDHHVTVTDAYGCSQSDTTTITGSPLYEFFMSDFYEIQMGDSVLLTITGDTGLPGLVYHWTPGNDLLCDTCSATLAFPALSTIYSVLITDANGCEYELETEIYVTPADTVEADAVYVPNVFTPDGDGVNDFFRLYSRHDETFLEELEIFDRWGNMMLHVDNILLSDFEGWDGQYRGRPMSGQVFAYRSLVLLSDGKRVILQGDVTLIR